MTVLEDVAGELRGPLKRFPTVALDRRPILALARLATRFSKTVPTDGVAIEELTGGGVHLRTYRPLASSSGAGMLWMHGGGLIAGDPKMDDALLGPVVAELGITVVSVGYRRAPEHPFPAPLDDAIAGWRWMLANAARLGIETARIAVGGESAGGSLAAASAQRIHDLGGVQPAAQWLMCPMLDDRTAARADLGDRDHLVWNNRNNRFAWRSYLQVEPGAAHVPEGSVPSRRADLTGMPATFIGIAALDLFADEDLDYAHRLRAAGVPVDVDLVRGALHGFQTWGAGTRIAEEYLTRARHWLGTRLAVDASRTESET